MSGSPRTGDGDGGSGRPDDADSTEAALLWALERCIGHAAGGATLGHACAEGLDGPELELRTSTEGGMHRVVGIAAAAAGDGAPPVLTPAQEALVRSTVMALLDLAGHESGLARTYVVLTAAGPRVRCCTLFRPGDTGSGAAVTGGERLGNGPSQSAPAASTDQAADERGPPPCAPPPSPAS